MDSSRLANLQAKYDKAGQGHVFTFYDSLSSTEQETLVRHLETIDVERVNRIFKTSTTVTVPSGDKTEGILAPLPDSAFDSLLKADSAKSAAWEEAGLKLLAQNKVGVILLAGGQGTRLGSSDPKGCYDIQLPSHKSLFQLQAERIARLQVVRLLPRMYIVSRLTAPFKTARYQVRIPRNNCSNSMVRHDLWSDPRSNSRLLQVKELLWALSKSNHVL